MLPRTLLVAGKHRAQSQEVGNLPFFPTMSPLSGVKGKKNSSKVKERSGNVYENKGSAFEVPQQGGNVLENKGSYAPKTGILLKTKPLSSYRLKTY